MKHTVFYFFKGEKAFRNKEVSGQANHLAQTWVAPPSLSSNAFTVGITQTPER